MIEYPLSCTPKIKKEMTLDCYIFLHRCFSQPRAISVHSYYLTSLVTSRFYRFGGRNLFIQSSIPSHIPSKLNSYTLICEKPQCGKLSSWKAFVLWLPVLSHFFPQQFIFRYNLACYFGNFFIITSIFAACDRLEPLGCYLFIGITLSGYNIAQGNEFCNTQYCTKWRKRNCV